MKRGRSAPIFQSSTCAFSTAIGTIRKFNLVRAEFVRLSDDGIRSAAEQANDLLQFMALAATAASRVLRQGLSCAA
jgi:hypothetical protein